MKKAMNWIGVGALAAILVAPVMYLRGSLELLSCQAVLLIATVVWFAAAAPAVLAKDHAKQA
ncbi:hypothetical protein [Botrimarina hoheduenensis]|uniref:Uncharacterized protein n=1 Tax=Botrimarina hoheduenensis TaxID=2528000 RepID=A0A5C5VWI0_9BACT|nr:hypothetical protein [Botrimarina hoheduenensis]TWT42884.1 hypothetical protein Pla111_25220 [Botrimarina hoheduenensis]